MISLESLKFIINVFFVLRVSISLPLSFHFSPQSEDFTLFYVPEAYGNNLSLLESVSGISN